MTPHEKLDALQAKIFRLSDLLTTLAADIDAIWGVASSTQSQFHKISKDVAHIKVIRAELGKVAKDVATMKSLWPRSYSKVG